MIRFTIFVVLISLALPTDGRRKLPFKIEGPKSLHDRIAIVGAGPAGIHMALSLKKRGFTNVMVLERSPFLGGKSWTINRRGAPHEMGTVYLAPDYQDLVVPLVKNYTGSDELVFLPEASIWLDEYGKPIPLSNYTLQYAMRYYQTNNPLVAVGKVGAAIKKYIKLHRDILGLYEGEIMPEPTKKVMNQIRGTFQEFLNRNNIGVLAALFYASETVQGYGRIDEIPTLYGMMWNTPRMMRGLLKRIEGKANETGFYMLKHGFSNLWKQIVSKDNIKIEYNVYIDEVYRSRKGGNTVWIHRSTRTKDGHFTKKIWQKYDFLIWSPDLKTSLKYWSPYEDEEFYFSRIKPTWFTTALVDTLGVTRGSSPIDYWFDNINKKRESSLWAQRDSYAALRDFKGKPYQDGSYPSGNDSLPIRTTITYQMSDKRPSRIQLRRILKKSLKEIGATMIKIHKLKTWRYFPKYSVKDTVKGYLWRILEMQGKHGMWYIGASACFESIKSVVEYNELILTNFDLPSRKHFVVSNQFD